MIAALVSFLGGSFLRLLLGEVFAWWTKRQDHSQEMDRMRLQGELDAAQHARNQDAIKTQAALGIQVVQAKAEAYTSGVESDAWLEAVKGTTKTIGVWWVDAWNGVIRPFVATWSIIVITIHIANTGWVLDVNGWSLCSAALGIYRADRQLFKRGK